MKRFVCSDFCRLPTRLRENDSLMKEFGKLDPVNYFSHEKMEGNRLTHLLALFDYCLLNNRLANLSFFCSAVLAQN
jgi:hypothetical protein